jgi:thiamine pyrophosphate-dependent acetolactate synthase large subunit-like protein
VILTALRESDLVLSLDWIDLGSTLQRAWGDSLPVDVVCVSLDSHLHRGWSKDHLSPVPATVRVAASPDAMVAQLLTILGQRSDASIAPAPAPPDVDEIQLTPDGQLTTAHIAAGLRAALEGRPATLARTSGAWTGDMWPCTDPLDYLGGDGGGGIGSGPGMAVGAALALRESDRLAVAVLGDGDFAMGTTAVWTAAHSHLPLVIVVANNRSFLNDEIHQHRVAAVRGRPIENRWIGQRLEGPTIDHAAVARGLGAHGIGPVRSVDQVEPVLREAIKTAVDGRPVVIDVWVGNEPNAP